MNLPSAHGFPSLEALDRSLAGTCPDALLELRAAMLDWRRRPQRAVDAFLRCRRLLARRDYLLQHRIRRDLEARLEVEITTPVHCARRPLRLRGRKLCALIDAERREVFEHSDVDWHRIRVRIVARNA